MVFAGAVSGCRAGRALRGGVGIHVRPADRGCRVAAARGDANRDPRRWSPSRCRAWNTLECRARRPHSAGRPARRARTSPPASWPCSRTKPCEPDLFGPWGCTTRVIRTWRLCGVVPDLGLVAVPPVTTLGLRGSTCLRFRHGPAARATVHPGAGRVHSPSRDDVDPHAGARPWDGERWRALAGPGRDPRRRAVVTGRPAGLRADRPLGSVLRSAPRCRSITARTTPCRRVRSPCRVP